MIDTVFGIKVKIRFMYYSVIGR